MDKIFIDSLEIFAYHGVNPEEKENGQKFILDILLSADLSKAKKSDNLVDTVNYSAVVRTVSAAFTAKKYDLIERAAQVTCEAILNEYPAVTAVKLKLKKPEAPIKANFNFVAVEIKAKRT